jgi:hypothetical protein
MPNPKPLVVFAPIVIAPPRIADECETRYPEPVSPSGRLPGETLGAAFKRQRDDPRSPGGVLDPKLIVTREFLSINLGKRARFCIGLRGKLYHRADYISPIVDSMRLLFQRHGWGEWTDDDAMPQCVQGFQMPRVARLRFDASDVSEASDAPAPSPPNPPAAQAVLCKGCGSTRRSDFTLTVDKSHLVCRCGVVSAPVHIALDREKNCAREEDKTTHADAVYVQKTDRFDHAALSCSELRAQQAQQAQGSRVSKKTREKMGIGWQHEHLAREAARAERQRNEMDPRDSAKNQHILIALEKLFVPLEPMDAEVKRFCRREADRAWREAVRHSTVCGEGARCNLRVREKGPVVIADACLTCSLSTLLEGRITLDGVSHSALLNLSNKLVAFQNAKRTSCALRAVRTVVARLLCHTGTEPIEPCVPSSTLPSPAPSSSSDASVRMPPVPSSLQRVDSSVSDVGEAPSELLLQRDAIHRVFQALGTMPNSVREASLRAIQNPAFRAALAEARVKTACVERLTSNELSYVLLTAVARVGEHEPSGRIPKRLAANFASDAAQLAEATDAVAALLPPGLNAVETETDELFG